MALWKEIGNRLAWLFRRSRFDRELEDEIGFHIQARADELEQADRCRPHLFAGAHAREEGPHWRCPNGTHALRVPANHLFLVHLVPGTLLDGLHALQGRSGRRVVGVHHRGWADTDSALELP